MDITQSEAAKKIALLLFKTMEQHEFYQTCKRLHMLFPKIADGEQEAVVNQIDNILQKMPHQSRSLNLCDENPDSDFRVEKIVTQMWFRLIRGLDFSPTGQIGEVIGRSDYVAQIATITIHGKIIHEGLIDGLLDKESKLSSLKNLSFMDSSVSPEVMTRLRTAARSGQIESLQFFRPKNKPSDFSAQHVAALFGGPGLDRLKALRLMYYFLDSDSLELMARSEGLMKIEHLLLSNNARRKDASPWTAGIQALLDSSSVLVNLRVLDLTGCPIGDESVIVIAKSPRAKQLTDLNLEKLNSGQSVLSQDAIFILATSPMLTEELKRKLVKVGVIPRWIAEPIGIVTEDNQNCRR